MTEEQNESTKPSDAKGVESSGLLGWIDASRHPLADVVDDEYVIFAGYEKLRLFAIATRGGWEYHAGSIDEDGTILSVEQDSTGRLVWDVDFYVEISEPNAQADPRPKTENSTE